MVGSLTLKLQLNVLFIYDLLITGGSPYILRVYGLQNEVIDEPGFLADLSFK